MPPTTKEKDKADSQVAKSFQELPVNFARVAIEAKPEMQNILANLTNVDFVLRDIYPLDTK